ncbi:MAG: hypothetical protein OQK12_07355 [Motiliproteus sp.]|nr:hypothetical protein [Motiliproteus sp.]MCW9053951.1 hypothetical protein [Motiliproteus sp.]
MEMTATAPKKKFPLSLLLLVALFGVPPLAGWLFFLNPQWLPDKHNNHGALVQPSLPIHPLGLLKADGSAVTEESLSDAWRMLVIADKQCETSCQKMLSSLTQVQKATGAGRVRLRPVLLMLNEGATPILASDLAETEVIYAPPQALQAVKSQFQLSDNSIDENSFIIDPMGALMMRHNHSLLSQKQVLKDMEKLLKISQSWLKGAQYGHN